jgi:hypothetical protein
LIGHRQAALSSLAALGLAAGAAGLPSVAWAQEEEREIVIPSIELEDFQLSGPPALVLLGISSSAVSRPNTPRALIASLVSAAGSSGLVPNGYAVETAPFWLGRHPALELQDYYHPSVAGRLRYFTALSAATSRPGAKSESVQPDALVSLAMRTLLVNGRPNPALIAASGAMRSAQLDYIAKYRQWEKMKPAAGALAAQTRKLARQEELLSSLVTRVLIGPDRELRDSTLRTLARRDSARSAVARAQEAADETTRLEGQMDALETKLSGLAKGVSKEEAEPDGLIVEIAAGTRALFAEGRWSEERVDGLGLWLTPMYRLSAHRLELVGVGRLLTRVAEYDDRSLLDVGGRAGWGIGRASLSGEWALRTARARRGAPQKRSSRWAAEFNYPLPAALQLVASFGSDFRRLDGDRPVIATIGLNLGLGAVMIVPGRSGTK